MSKYVKRMVSTEFWEDQKVMTVFTPEDKYFMLYLLTNPHTTQLGIYRLVPKIAAFEMGYSVEAVDSLIERFSEKYGIISYNRETMEVAIKNYLIHSVIKGGKPVLDCLKQDAQKVKDKSLLFYIAESMDGKDVLPTVREFIDSIKEESTKEEKIILFNDNDNDSNVDVTCTLRGNDAVMAEKYGFTASADLLSTFTDFIRMRKSIKKPMSDRAVLLLSNKLTKLSGNDISKKIDIMNQSIYHCWQDVYELKDKDNDDYQQTTLFPNEQVLRRQ